MYFDYNDKTKKKGVLKINLAMSKVEARIIATIHSHQFSI